MPAETCSYFFHQEIHQQAFFFIKTQGYLPSLLSTSPAHHNPQPPGKKQLKMQLITKINFPAPFNVVANSYPAEARV